MSDVQEGEPRETPEAVCPTPEPAECWRCGKRFDALAAACPYCRARRAQRVALDSPGAVRESGADIPSIDPTSPVVRLIGFYAVLLATSIVFAMIVRARYPDGIGPDETDRVWLMHATLTLEVIDTVVVLAAWYALRRPGMPHDLRSPARAWMAAGPALALLLVLNFGYHGLLMHLAASPAEPERMLPGREWLSVVCYGLQPALVEEMFFRGLAIDWFRAVMTTRAALLVSSVMFGLCHIYTPASVPYLIVAGIVFGAARLATGGLLLPMCLHFLHNIVIVLFEHYRA
jgi:uncharacterized protein